MKNLMKFRFAGIQLLVGADKEANLRRASAKIAEAVANGAEVVSLPECFNSPYSTASFGPYSEVVGEGPTTAMLRSAAAEHRIVLIGGSFPEKEVVNGQEKYYNTSLIFDEEGTIIGKHRKIHLFDIDIPGGITFRESDTLSRGNTPTIVNTKYGKLGIGICYDLRFPELAAYYAQQGCQMLCYPAAFNTTTGPKHWELLQRARAVDNQVWLAAVSPARNPDSTYQAWGHSNVIDPWGVVSSTCEHEEAIIYMDIDHEVTEQFRAQIPVLRQKRTDLFQQTYSPLQE